MTRTRWLQVALGVSALATAIWLFATGSTWVGFWLLVLAVGLLVREPMRRYKQRVEKTDPAEPAPRLWSLLRRLNVSDPAPPPASVPECTPSQARTRFAL